MRNVFERLSLAIVPAMFLVAAAYFFKTQADLSGAVCIVLAFLTARN